MITSILAKVMDLAALSAKERARVKALRENLTDEVKHNRRILQDYLSRTTRIRVGTDSASDAKVLLSSLRRSDYEKVRGSEMPLGKYFPEPLLRPDAPDKSDGKGTRQYLAWTRNDLTVSDLIKRFYSNVEFFKSRPEDSRSKVDVRYLVFLLKVIDRSIKK